MLSSKSDSTGPSSNLSDRRTQTRFEIFAQANVASGGDSYLMSVRNISGSGVFLEGRPQDHKDLAVGVEVEVALSVASAGMNDEEVVNIQCTGKVARVELPAGGASGGFGVSLSPATAADQDHLDELLSRLADLPPAMRPANLG
jgi:hypothetical protein